MFNHKVQYANINPKKLATYRDAHEVFMEELSKSKQKREIYLKVAIEDYEETHELHFFLMALRNIAIAGGGIAEIAKKTKLNRQTIYKALSPNGNPSFHLVEVILNSLGMKIAIKSAKNNLKKTRSK
jgi:probable addiction module antidote protein